MPPTPLQMGPLAMLAAVPIRALDPSAGRLAAPTLLTLTGPILLWALVRAREAVHGPVSQVMLLLTGVFLLPVWTEVTTHYAHLDDVLAMAFGLAALLSASRGRPLATGLLLAGAVDSKPWALGFLALLLVLPARERISAAAVASIGVALAWLPFVLTDPATLALTHFTIPNVHDSALRVLGYTGSATPWWDRPAQLLLGAAAAYGAIRRGRWPLALLTVLAVRLLLDPETYSYYSSSLLLAAAAADLLTAHRRLPLWTASAATWFALDATLSGWAPPHALGVIRAAFCLALLAAALLSPREELREAPHVPSGSREVPAAGSSRDRLTRHALRIPRRCASAHPTASVNLSPGDGTRHHHKTGPRHVPRTRPPTDPATPSPPRSVCPPPWWRWARQHQTP